MSGSSLEEPQKIPTILVVGGGISGLAAAHRIVERSRSESFPVRLILVEASERLGGVIVSSRRDGFLLEGASDSFITDKPWAIDLCRRLGLSEELIETNTDARRSFVVRDGRPVPVPEGFHLLAPARTLPFLRSSLLSAIGKLRVCAEYFLPKKSSQEDESIASFVRRRFGQEALERIAQPMVSAIYGADPDQLSMRATLPRFLELEKTYGSVIRGMRKKQKERSARSTSGPRYGLFLSLRGGMQTLVDRLISHMPEAKVRFRTKALALERSASTERWRLSVSGGEVLEADAVCLALPAYAAGVLLKEADSSLSQMLNSVPYGSMVTTNLAYRRSDIPHPLDGFGVVVPTIERLPILGCSFSSIKFEGRAPQGNVLLRVFLAETKQQPVSSLSECAIINQVRKTLKTLLEITAPPLFSSIHYWNKSMPHYPVGHLGWHREVQQRVRTLPGLALAGNAYSGVGIPDCIHTGEVAADHLVEKLKQPTASVQEVSDNASFSS